MKYERTKSFYLSQIIAIGVLHREKVNCWAIDLVLILFGRNISVLVVVFFFVHCRSFRTFRDILLVCRFSVVFCQLVVFEVHLHGTLWSGNVSFAADIENITLKEELQSLAFDLSSRAT